MIDFAPQSVPSADQCLQSLRQTRQVLLEVDLNEANRQPHSWLWQKISPVYRPAFDPDQLILCSFQGVVDQDLLDHLQKILAQCDISNNFVLVVTDDLSFGQKSRMAQIHSTDVVPIAHQLVRFLSGQPQESRCTTFALPDTMCIAPWARLEISADGTYKPCCAISVPIKDDRGQPMTVYEHGLDQVYHSDFLRDLRHQLRQGHKPSACTQCWRDESMGRQSIRQHVFWDLKNEQFNLDWDIESTKNLRSWHLSLGNTCNLKCRTCGPGASSQWAVEIINSLDKADRKSSKVKQQLKKAGWAESTDLQVWKDIENTHHHVTELRFTGGEPMLLRRQFDLVEHISTTPRANKIDLVYTTNGTHILPKDFVAVLGSYKSVSISLSIDDIGARFEYQRSGASWDLVQKNVQWYAALKSRLNNYTLKTNCTVSIMNVFYLPEFVDWLEDQCFDFVRLNVLYHPRALSISSVTKELQTACVQRLVSRSYPSHIQDQIDSITTTLRCAEVSDGQEFCDYVRVIDQRRKENYAEHHPEVANLMNYQLQSDFAQLIL